MLSPLLCKVSESGLTRRKHGAAASLIPQQVFAQAHAFAVSVRGWLSLQSSGISMPPGASRGREHKSVREREASGDLIFKIPSTNFLSAPGRLHTIPDASISPCVIL